MALPMSKRTRLNVSVLAGASVPHHVSTGSSVSFGKREAGLKFYRCVHEDVNYTRCGDAARSCRCSACSSVGVQAVPSNQFCEFCSLPLMPSRSECELLPRFCHDRVIRERSNLRIRESEGKCKLCAGRCLARYRHRPRVSGNNFHQEITDRLLWASTQLEKKRIFIFGIGFASSALAGYLLKNNWIVSGTCRSNAKKEALEKLGCRVDIFNSDNEGEKLREEALRELQQANYWLVSVPPVLSANEDPILAVHLRLLEEAVKLSNVEWIGYLSSTGVYGDWQGEWVDEESEPRPVEPRAVARLTAEKAWLKFGLDNCVFVHIFRLGGIYGPGRSALDVVSRNKILSERQHRREQQRYTSRIHVADICQAVIASLQNPSPGRIYNVVDDDPASRATVLEYARNLVDRRRSSIGRYAPIESSSGSAPEITPNVTNAATQIAEKRVSNQRLKRELRVQLIYPSYKSGLDAIFEASFDNLG